MVQSLARTTVIDQTGAHDYTVPAGTTIAGLMATLTVDLSDPSLNVTTADGRKLDGGAVIGHDLPSGSVIALSRQTESRKIAAQVARLNELPWFPSALASTLLLSFLIIAEGSVLVAPLIGLWEPPTALRWLTAILSALICAAAISLERVRTHAWFVLALSLFFGLTATAAIPAETEFAASATQLAIAWWALLASLSAWVIYDFVLGALTSGIWAGIVAVSTITSYYEISFTTLAPLIVAIAVLLTTLTPSLAIRIPETQLLDMPLVTTMVGRLRGPEPAAPSDITMPRVQRTINEGKARTQTLLIACTVLILISAPSLATLMDHQTWEGRAAIGVIACSSLLLLITGRNRREHSARIIPQIGALGLIISALTASLVTQTIGTHISALILLLLGCAYIAVALIATVREPSALIGWILDVCESLSLILLLPAAVYAAGVFTLIRQVAS